MQTQPLPERVEFEGQERNDNWCAAVAGVARATEAAGGVGAGCVAVAIVDVGRTLVHVGAGAR